MTPPVLRIGLIGNGTVGAAFATALAASSDRIARRLPARLRLTQVAVLHPDKHAGAPLGGARVHDDAAALAADPTVDLVVEASGDLEARRWIRTALDRGAAAVSANKLALASDAGLLALIAQREPRLQCEAAVAAAVPVIRALRDSLDAEEIHEIRGVLNGTTTYILSQIERGARFSDALRQAQDAGYAEADATADLSGRDAAAKLAILATLAWRRPYTIDDVVARGIDASIDETVRFAATHGAHVRLVAHAREENGVALTVEPRILSATDRLSQSEGVTNVVEVRSAFAGPLTWFGAGAGGTHTASALLGDLLVAARALTGASGGIRATYATATAGTSTPTSAVASRSAA